MPLEETGRIPVLRALDCGSALAHDKVGAGYETQPTRLPLQNILS